MASVVASVVASVAGLLRAVALPLAVLAPLALLAGPAGAADAVEVLGPELVARLDPAREKPLALSASGDVARFVAGDGDWEEGAPPVPLDLDRDGVPDYVVFAIVDSRSERRAVVIHGWGETDRDFGPAVFYVLIGPSDVVEEWGGQHRLAPRAASPSGPSRPEAPAAPRPAP